MEIYHFDSIPSTNTALWEMSKKGAKSWTVIWSSNQTDGKGYSGNSWSSEKDKNLAVSLLIKSDLTYNELIYFNQWVCNCICDLFKNYTDSAFVKWPNDIIINNKKICGVLIETYKSDNQLNMIVGVGINVNQESFSGLKNAGSLFTETNRFYDIKEILSDLLTKFDESYSKIRNCEWEPIIHTYNSNLFRRDCISRFRIEDKIFSGTIRFVDDSGLLNVELENKILEKFKHKAIELLY